MSAKINEAFNVHIALAGTYNDISKSVVQYAPKLLGAVILLVLGWVVAMICRALTRKIINKLDFIFKVLSIGHKANPQSIKHSYGLIISKIVYWIIILFFLAASSNFLGWRMFTGWIDSLINYLPSLLSGAFIILLGLLASNALSSTVARTASAAGIENSEIVRWAVKLTFLSTILIIGISQIGINVDFLTSVFDVIVGVLLAGGAFAFSLGSKLLVSNLIAAQYIRKHCAVGERMKIGDVEGDILEITQTNVVLDCDNGRVAIPAKLFFEQLCHFTSPELSADNQYARDK